MSRIIQRFHNETWDGKGNRVSHEFVDVDVTEMVNTQALHSAARDTLAANRAYVASTPNAAQTAAQVKALSRQVNGIIRLLLNELDGVD
jgi:hypothetical protein